MTGQQAITTAVYVTAGSGRFHEIQECFVLGRHTTLKVYVVSLAKARRAGRQPCQFCCDHS